MKRFTWASSILMIFQAVVGISAANASDYTQAPSDINSFQANLDNSLVSTTCGGIHGVGFAGNYIISTEQKNLGINTLILTSGTATYACRFVGGVVSIDYQGKKYDAPTRFWNGQNPDYAVIQSTLSIPNLGNYGYVLPEVGWWVDVVQNIPGFGLVWNHSTIRLVNSNYLQLAIDPVIPNVTDNALVFDNQGTFLGMLSSFGVTEPAGEVIVQGAPLQCQLSKENSSPTATNCEGGKLAGEIWKPVVIPIPTQTSTPTQTPTPVPTPTSTVIQATQSTASQYCVQGGYSDGLCSDSPNFEYNSCGIGKTATMYYLNKKKYIKYSLLVGTLDRSACTDPKKPYSYYIVKNFNWTSSASPQMKVVYNAIKGKATDVDLFSIYLQTSGN